MGLYNRFVDAATMQNVHEEFKDTKYTPDNGVQGFYDALIDCANNMATFPDDYAIKETFMMGILEKFCEKDD